MSPGSVRSIAAAFLLAGAAALLPLAALAAPADPNETCLACHSDKDAKGTTGKSIAVDAAVFAKSVHGAALPCTACHTDVSEKTIPHPEKLKPVDCGTCHEKAVTEYKDTIHGTARKDGSQAAATCVDCHGKHDILPGKDPGSRTSHDNVEATCATCHGKASMIGQAKMPGGAVANQFHDSIHGKALAGAARSAAPTCTNCHGAHDIHAKDDTRSKAHRANVLQTCGSCHGKESRQFTDGRHGKLRQEGNLGAPGCTDCHGAHRIESHVTPAFQVEVIDECGTCHADYMKTYRDTFHGKVTNLGYMSVATCASCHGAHDVRPASDPASMVSPQNRLATCQKCHAGASANFAQWDPHANKHDRERNPLYYYMGLFMHWLLIGVFAFFGLHTLLWLYRSLRARRDGTPPPAGGGRP